MKYYPPERLSIFQNEHKSREMKKIQYIVYLIITIGYAACIPVDNSTPYSNMNNGFVADEEWLYNFSAHYSIMIPGAVFPQSDINVNNDKGWVVQSGFMVTSVPITIAQYTFFLNSINCNSDGWFMGKQMFIPERLEGISYELWNNGLNGMFNTDDFNSLKPVVGVTWFGAKTFCEWVGGELLTEAQYNTMVKNYENNNANYFQHDLDEWCFDWFSNSIVYQNKKVIDPIGPNTGDGKLCVNYDRSNQYLSRSIMLPDSALNNLTFRCAWPLSNEATNAPVITSFTPELISSTTATINGTLEVLGDGFSASIGIIYGLDQDLTFENCIGVNHKLIDQRSFSFNLTGLKSNTSYFAKCFSVNSMGSSISQNIEFRTLPALQGYKKGLIDIEMVLIEGGDFIMGDNAYPISSPEHTVKLSAFYIGKYEVTHYQFVNFLNSERVESSGYKDGIWYFSAGSGNIFYQNGEFHVVPGFENYPVEYVTWQGAQAFCHWCGGSLPTEAQWEFAALGGGKSKMYRYSGSNVADEVAWYSSNSSNVLHSVGQKMPNELGLFDCSGNASEWCYDWFSDYKEEMLFDPQVSSPYIVGVGKVVKGGKYTNSNTGLVPTVRKEMSVDSSGSGVGFRLVKAR
ncbi:MAG: SUMF1/EgtB/PvdO family nonheme iron enzyme [Prolixibacteraceae bacterium]|nr:SUMF1/EgtB/PvdO family nonheme iron enzyme [Prolixibacteraceae bacterium]